MGVYKFSNPGSFRVPSVTYRTMSTVTFPNITGGVLTSDSQYYYRTFSASDTLYVQYGSIEVTMLVVAGGGGAGYGANGGGGGGGGFLEGDTTLTAGEYVVAIGAGGAGSGFPIEGQGSTGINTTFGNNINAFGGGAGSGPININGGAGGSGGGGGFNGSQYGSGGAATQTSVAGLSGYGNAGGGGAVGSRGGGAGSAASGASSGGAGRASVINAVTYAAGGIESGPTLTPANTGNGANRGSSGQNGGSGIVIVRYLKSEVGG